MLIIFHIIIYFIFDQINEALANIRDLFEKRYKKLFDW